jgi:hypothetical protein
MSVPANFTIVTLGVADLERSVAFYRGLGWEQRGSCSGSCPSRLPRVTPLDA